MGFDAAGKVPPDPGEEGVKGGTRFAEGGSDFALIDSGGVGPEDEFPPVHGEFLEAGFEGGLFAGCEFEFLGGFLFKEGEEIFAEAEFVATHGPAKGEGLIACNHQEPAEKIRAGFELGKLAPCDECGALNDLVGVAPGREESADESPEGGFVGGEVFDEVLVWIRGWGLWGHYPDTATRRFN